MSIQPNLHPLQACAQRINASIGNVFAQLNQLVDGVRALWEEAEAAGRQPCSRDLEVLRPKIDAHLLESRSCAYGAGVVLEPGVLADQEMYLEWRRLVGQQKTVPLRLNFNQRSENFYNYLGMPWFRVPRETGRSTVASPYVDLYGSDMYVMTFTTPIMVGDRFIGVAGADVPLHSFERVLARSLVRLEQDALVLSADGRVIASNTADWSVGELACQLLANVDGRCSVLELSEMATWSLVCLPSCRRMAAA